MDAAKLREQLMAVFLDELDEHVATIGEDVLVLERCDDAERPEVVARLFRAAHSLKGAARAVDVPPIERVCHHLEDLFAAVRDGRISVTTEVSTLALRVGDGIGTAGAELRSGGSIDPDPLEALHEPLRAAAAGEPFEIAAVGSVEPPAEQPVPTPDPYLRSVTPEAPTAAPESIPSTDDARTTPARPVAASVRVAREKLDALLAQTGELLVTRQRIGAGPGELDDLVSRVTTYRAEWRRVETGLVDLVRESELDGALAAAVVKIGERLREIEKDVERIRKRLLGDARQLDHTGAALQEDVHRLRMVPFSEGCSGLERAVRDVARTTGREVELVLEGGDIEVDRNVLEGLRDPLLHLVRNAVDHGIEPPTERRASGKPEQGTVRVRATLRGPRVDVEVSDDGRGLDVEAIRTRIRERGLPEPADPRDLVRAILLPGFSTARMVTDVSGRGVGMDVVKDRVERLHGTIDISSEPGFGTRFLLSVPLTLTTMSALFVRAGEPTLAIPSHSVDRVVRFRVDELRRVGGEDVLCLGEAPVPVRSLAATLGFPAGRIEDRAIAVLLSAGGRSALFVVDEAIGEWVTVVKGLGPRVHRLRHVSGATLLRSGGVALLLNVGSLLRTGIDGPGVLPEAAFADEESTGPRRLLVVDDSVTTRSLLKTILASAGYEVTTAVDGEDAWQRLVSGEFDAVVTDVDMPRLDGFELTARIRDVPEYGTLPVVLVTSRDDDRDKARGVAVGADAYVVKSAFDQSGILDTIEHLL